MKLFALLTLATGLVFAQEVAQTIPQPITQKPVAKLLTTTKRDVTQFKWSLAAVALSSALDIDSSRGLEEMNPILGGNRPFLMSDQGRNKMFAVTGLVLAEALIVQKWPASAKVLKWVNFTYSGVTTGVAIHNYGIGGGSSVSTGRPNTPILPANNLPVNTLDHRR